MQVLRDRVEGSSDCYLHKSSDDRSDSWGLESVTYHYPKQGYEIEQAFVFMESLCDWPTDQSHKVTRPVF